MARAKARGLIVLAVACAATLAATVPHLDRPVSRLANYRPDSADPIWDNHGTPPTDGAALRRAGALLPGRTTYYVEIGNGPPGLVHDVLVGASLFFPPALRVLSPADADWVLDYRADRLVPEGLRPGRVYRVGDGIFLVRVRRV